MATTTPPLKTMTTTMTTTTCCCRNTRTRRLDNTLLVLLSTIFAVVIISNALLVESFVSSPFTGAAIRKSSLLLPPLSSSVAAVNGDTTTGTNANDDEENNNKNSDGIPSPPADIRLNVYEKARTVTSVCTSGTLCTVSSHAGIEGAPFGSFVDYVLDDAGNPVFLMNEMSMHTVNIQKAMDKTTAKTEQGDQQQPAAAEAMVTLFTQLGNTASSGAGGGGGLGASRNNNKKGLQDVSRCSLTGTLERLNPKKTADMDAIRMRYSLTHSAYADQVMDSPKFAFYRLRPSKIYFVGGFGVLSQWVDPADYKAAEPDILAGEASDICARLHREHQEDLELTARHLLGVGVDEASGQTTPIERITVTNVDRLGMDIRVTSQKGTRRNKLQTDEFRIGFRIPVIAVEDAKSEILKTFQEAWEIANGYSYFGDEEGEGDDDGNNETTGSTVPIMKIAADSLE